MKVSLGLRRVATFAAVVWLAAALQVSATNMGNHYVNGVEGIKGASVPPPGLYWRMYNVSYQADELTDADGNSLPIGFDLDVFAWANRIIWVSNCKFLGADLGADALIPLVYTHLQVKAADVKDSDFGLGDIYFEPLLMAWHMPRCDVGFGLAAYAPTGDHEQPAEPGKDYWTGMITLGSTVFFDAERTWSLSVLGRYEIHGERSSDDVTPGNDLHFEWGLGKTLCKTWDVGVAGYSQWQVTDDSGAAAGPDRSTHDSVHAIGPEVSVFLPPAGLFCSLRYAWEFQAKDRTEGQVGVLTLTKIL